MSKKDDGHTMDYVTITTEDGNIIDLGSIRDDNPEGDLVGVATGELYEGSLTFNKEEEEFVPDEAFWDELEQAIVEGNDNE